jgi:multidrug efflux system outer membrane protein
VISACNFAPDYERPDVPLPVTYTEPHVDGTSIANIPWWSVFADEKLQLLIKEALANNKDVGLAMARIEESKAIVTFTRSDQFPFLNARADYGRGDLGLELPAAGSLSILGELTFEVDLWSKLRNATQAQRALLLSSTYGLQTTIISLISQVAELYFTLIDIDARIAISRETVKNRRVAKDIIAQRFQKGIVSELELNQAQIEEITVQVNLIALERAQKLAEHALWVLLGKTSGGIERKASFYANAITLSMPSDVPAAILQRRPDLLALEENLKAQFSLEGSAIAQRLPSLQILGTLGLASVSSTDVFGNDTQTWSIGGSLFSPLLNYGKNEARVDAQKARVEQAKRIYEDAVIKSVREVEDSLIEIQTYEREFKQRREQIKVSRNANILTRARYDNGVATYVEVLDIERSRYTAELDASLTYRRYLTSLAKLYRALGGGWDPEAIVRK